MTLKRHAQWYAVLAPALLLAQAAHAASLTPVNDWNSAGITSLVGMSIYVPDARPAHPAVIVLVHYCGGNSEAVFWQAVGGGLISAADQYGHIVVVP